MDQQRLTSLSSDFYNENEENPIREGSGTGLTQNYREIVAGTASASGFGPFGSINRHKTR